MNGFITKEIKRFGIKIESYHNYKIAILPRWGGLDVRITQMRRFTYQRGEDSHFFSFRYKFSGFFLTSK
jgi:hypothetical protein